MKKRCFFHWSSGIKKIQLVPQVEEMGGQIQQNGGLGPNHHQGQDTKPRQVTSVQVRRGLWRGIFTEKVNLRRWKMFNCFQRSLPAYARVKQSRVPNAYDKTALRLEVHIRSWFQNLFCWKNAPSYPTSIAWLCQRVLMTPLVIIRPHSFPAV